MDAGFRHSTVESGTPSFGVPVEKIDANGLRSPVTHCESLRGLNRIKLRGLI